MVGKYLGIKLGNKYTKEINDCVNEVLEKASL